MHAPAAHHDPTAADGRLLGGRYELRSLIARGGMGRVWRATDTLLGRDVAVKVLHSEYTGDATFLTRFRSEARLAALLADPHIAAVHDYGESPDGDGGEYVAYLVMELVDGEPLSDLLRRTPGGLDAVRTLSIVRQTAAALATAHAAGVVHRDVKPANILLTGTGAVKLTDFGIAWSASSAALTRAGAVVGTVHYLAPEQVEGAKATPASDVYSLGVVAYECLAGRRPFEGEISVQTALRHVQDVPDALPPHVPDDVRQLVEHAMARDPQVRLADGAALRNACDALPTAQAAALDAYDTVQLAVPAPDAGESQAGRRWVRPAAIAGVLVLLAVVLGVLAGGGAGSTGGPAAPPTPSAGSTPTAAPAIRLAAADLVGQPVADVQARLTAAGLQVELRVVETAATPAGAVVSVSPLGELAPGMAVTVTYATAPAAPATTAPAPAAPPTTTRATAATSAAPPANHGHGRGGGHGKNG